MDISKYTNVIKLNNNYNKRTGLLNVGATCYINTLIQCLLSCPVFREFILSKDYYDRIDDEKIYMIKELQSIFNSMWNQGHSLNPKRFLNTLAIKFDYIEVNQQNDVHEIFLLIINKLSEEIKTIVNMNNIKETFTIKSNNQLDELKNKCNIKWFETLKNEYSELNEIMYYHSISQIVCGSCEHIHHNHDISCVMDIELGQFKNGTPLKNCIENHISKIHLNIDEDSKWKCDECNQYAKSDKVIKFWKLPSTLVICLKRFGYDRERDLMTKINTFIDIPTEIDLSEFVMSSNDNKYRLCAVSCHIGNIRGGHYYSLVYSKSWGIIDDTRITFIDKKTFENHLNNAYLLFYTKI